MKKFLNSIKFIGKVFFLILLLIFSWAFVNIANLVKSKKETRTTMPPNLFGPDDVSADVPGKGTSTPFLAVFDGKEYKLENDILFGRPKSYYHSFDVAKDLYEDGRISPDLLKIASPIRSFDGKIKLQIQEIELEESFIKWVDLKRVLHPRGTQVIVDAEYKKFYVLNRDELLRRTQLPKIIFQQGKQTHGESIFSKGTFFLNDAKTENLIRFNPNDSIEFTFGGLKPNDTPFVLLKSWFRDWVIGLEADWDHAKEQGLSSIFKNITLARALVLLPFLAVGLWLGKKGFASLPFVPFFAGECVSCSCSCSFVHEYETANGKYHRVSISEPRAWKFNSELIEFPREAVREDGTMRIRIRSSKRHTLGFVGVVQNLEKCKAENYSLESLSLSRAFHHRTKYDFVADLQDQRGLYAHTVPGDSIDLEFKEPSKLPTDNQQETYLIAASGFYTALRPVSEKLAGNWREKISSEAKERLASLVSLRSYR